jgi:hypothetical protein
MEKTIENDLIFRVINNHFTETQNLNASEIKTKVKDKGIDMQIELITKRIDEYKQSRYYKSAQA